MMIPTNVHKHTEISSYTQHICVLVDCVWNVIAHAQKPEFVFRRNGRVHLNRQGDQFSRLLAAEVCASAMVMLDAPCYEVVWRALATHSIRQFPLHFPFRASPCAITFQLDSTIMHRSWIIQTLRFFNRLMQFLSSKYAAFVSVSFWKYMKTPCILIWVVTAAYSIVPAGYVTVSNLVISNYNGVDSEMMQRFVAVNVKLHWCSPFGIKIQLANWTQASFCFTSTFV
jgi:hypothetical protein